MEQRTCSVSDCGKTAYGRTGLCKAHYERRRLTGSADLGRPLRRRRGTPAHQCRVEGCPKDARSSDGLCVAHFHRLKRHGDPLGGGVGRSRDSVAEKFWAGVDKNGPLPATHSLAHSKGRCWLWARGHFANGYGEVSRLRTHRVAYELCVGPISDGLEIDHLCLNKGCCNPDHLEPVTRQENTQRAHDFGCFPERPRPTACVNGHTYDDENPPYVRKDTGAWECRICRKAASQRHKRRAGSG